MLGAGAVSVAADGTVMAVERGCTDPGLNSLTCSQPSALVVNSAVKVNSVGDLVALLKREHGKFNYGSIGVGSLSHLAMEAIAIASGTSMVHVPYPGSPAAMTAIVRGDVQIGCLPAIAAIPHAASADHQPV